ncbi:hypothetical protein LSCM1_03492 [Leishmania martiniquensis]|uniref:Schlafen AlbA-2 domain-containing protein n=1 Tax=Leishmania martiniquensis TaxID=1580590 RepID=A0A836GKE1_9TRYP|nr:hypothetical protein LSCM1_03492 [Leishmania martiniquensis]
MHLVVDLSPFFAGAACVLVNCNGAELAISRAFASAANACHEAHRPQRSRVSVAVQLRIQSTLPSWTRQAKDVLLRCVDRAVMRIFPPLDALQYLDADSPVFLAADAAACGESSVQHLCATFKIQPSACLWPSSLLREHAVEGEVVSGVRLGESETEAAAARQSMDETLCDLDLWNRTRAVHQLHETSIALDRTPQRSGDMTAAGATPMDTAVALQPQQQAWEEQRTKLQWQLARWLTELFMNEGSWAQPRGPPTTGSLGPAQKSSMNVATRRLFQSPLRLSFAHVVDAALAAPNTSSHGAEPGTTVPRRFLHADVRGVEWDGLLIGYTTRYAYIAVPNFVAPTEAASAVAPRSSCVWSFVSRIPIPAFLSESVARDAEGRPSAKGCSSQKRPRTSASHHLNSAASEEGSSGASAARRVLAHCLNAEEVMRHDTNAETVFRLADMPCVTTVRAHRVYCARVDPRMHAAARSWGYSPTKVESAASPYALSLVLEDAYAVRMRVAPGLTTAALTLAMPSTTTHWAVSLLCGDDPQPSPESDGEEGGRASRQSASDAVARAVHTFPDLVSVVQESCHRFQRAHERFRALYARCVQARGAQTSTVSDTAPRAEEAMTEGPSLTRPRKAPAEAAVRESELAATKEALLPTVASQNLLLLRQAEAVYSALSDSVSVRFGKLRGAARVPVPDVRTTADVAQLEECHNVEFKAKVGLKTKGSFGGADSPKGCPPVLMDAERLRHTMAAMASCRGGVILLGVTDDGRILGHANQLDAVRQLRTSGFCPAMVKGTVQVKELRCLGVSGHVGSAREAGSSESHDNGASPSAQRVMPANWWKGSVTPGLPNASAEVGGGASPGDRIITVVTVQKGQAPFYATAKHTPPYQRGCASTTMMPVVVVARRIMQELG